MLHNRAFSYKRILGDVLLETTTKYLQQTIMKTVNESSIYKHKLICKSKFEYSILATARDIVKLRFMEAIHIKANKPEINSKEEANELNHLIF